jgi:hypothetical protein
MPDIHDMELDARPSVEELEGSNAFTSTEIALLKEYLAHAEDILNKISSESNPSYLVSLCKEYFEWKHENSWKQEKEI